MCQYFVCYIQGSTSLIFRSLYPQRCCSNPYISYTIFMEVLLLYFVRYVHGYMNLHHFATFLRITFSQNTSGWLLLDFFIHVTTKLIFAIHLPNTNYVFCILEHALSRLSNVMSIMVLAFGKITQRRRPIEAAVRVCSRETALKNFASCTGKHLCWDRFLIKLQAFHDSNTGVFL